MSSREVDRLRERGIGMADYPRYHDAAGVRGADEPRPGSPEAQGALPAAPLVALLNAAWPADDRPRPGALRVAAREIAHAGRTAGLRPEQFIAALKEGWRADPRVRTAVDQIGVRERLAAVVTVCIEEYYAE